MELKNTEKQEHSVIALTIEITKAEFEAAKDKAFKKTGKNITVPGFRKGHAPRKMIEKLYGEGVFFEEAFNIIYPEAMEMAVEKSGIKPVGRADVDLGDPAEEGGLTIIAKVPVEPEVELGEYKGIEVEKETVKVLAADVKAELNRLAQRNARTETVDRKAKKNDTVDIDFEGFVDGVAFEGGKAENYSLTLGSGSFIPGFEDQLIGCKAGDEKDVVVTFPEDYHAKELAGKEAVFKCKVHKVEETILPEMDDEFAKDVSETCETLDDLKKEISDRLKKERQEAADHAFEEKVLDAVIANMKADIPQAMIESQIDSIVQDFRYRVQMQGMTFEQYLQMTGTELGAFRAMFKDQAERQVKSRLVLEKVAELENIAVSDKEMEEEYAKMAEQYNMDVEKVKSIVAADALRDDLKISNALEFLKKNAKAKKATKKKADEEAAEETAE
ncbi:trigger factor [Agathobaculum sp. Marseille-P7918]|uniref:trigger factor n=1 Tax=Agathobaculum sp. Marseille-P7918 TaxID=2479843 RepID=UPI000F638472|nr:trigger factor [Agathobaculum sp. Marseille-P7918]